MVDIWMIVLFVVFCIDRVRDGDPVVQPLAIACQFLVEVVGGSQSQCLSGRPRVGNIDGR